MITVTTNYDYLIDPVRMRIGDIDENLYSDNFIRTALSYGIRFLQQCWGAKYLIYTSDMLVSGTTINTAQGTITLPTLPAEHSVFRNPFSTFTSNPPPIIDQLDEPAIILAGAIQLRRAAITSSASAFGSWATPDLSYSNIQGAKTVQSLLEADEKELQAYFKGRLAHPAKQPLPKIYL